MGENAANPRAFRIFVSSPGDLGEERLICARVIETLKPEFARSARIEAILWEQEPLTADAGFQEQIVLPSQTDIVVILIWSRLGYRLHSKFKQEGDAEAPTGTIFEFRDALDARRRNPAKTPDMMVYRKTAEPPKPSVTDREAYLKTLDDYERVEAFFNSAFFKDANNEGAFTGAFHTFKRGSDFAENFERHIRTMISRRLGDQAMARTDRWKGGSPFRGLQAFDFEHRELFAGRVRAAMELREALRRQAAAGRAFVLVMGMSGGGKSSLVKAGVLPDLVQPGVIEGVALWRRLVFRPGAAHGDLLRGFATALLAGDRERGLGLPELAEDETTPKALADRLRESPTAAALIVEGGLRHAADAERLTQRERLQQKRLEFETKGQFDEVAEIDRVLKDLKPPKARLALVVDQLEELFTDPRLDEPARQAFVALLAALARGGRTWILATLRSDFFARCEQFPELVALKEGDGTYHLLAPNDAEIGQMIRHPARSTGLEYEKNARTGESLSDVLAVAATRQPGSLPLLQFTLDELYQRGAAAGRPSLTFADYEALGGLEGAIARRAEEIFTKHSHQDSRATAALPLVFAGLVQVTPGVEAAGRAVSAAAPLVRFASVPGGPELVSALTEARLLVSDRGEVRVAHEALLKHWPRLQEWIAQNGEFLLTRARLAAAAARWQAEAKAEDFLLPRGKPLVEAEEVLAARRADLTAEEVAYIEASSEARHREERAAAARRRQVLVAISAAALVAVAFAILSLVQSKRADAAASRATQARNQAEKLIDFMGVDLPKKLAPIGRLELLDSTNQRIRDYYKAFGDRIDADPEIRGRQATALMNEAEIQRARGNLAGALVSYREVQTLRKQLADAEPGSAVRATGLSQVENRIGDVFSAQGKLEEALKAYRGVLERRQAAARREPASAGRSQEVAESLCSIGRALVSKGDLPAALTSYREALALDRQRAQAEPKNQEWQQNVYATLMFISETLQSQGDLAGADQAMDEALRIVRALLEKEPRNAFWQRDLGVLLERQGDVLSLRGEVAKAVEKFRESLRVRRKLAAQDPSNSQWQSDLAGTLVILANALTDLGETTSALREFADALALRETLLELDPRNAAWQRELGVVHERIGAALLAQKNFPAALQAFQRSLATRRKLSESDPGNSQWRSEVFICLTLVGDAERALERPNEALSNYRAAIAIIRELVARDRSNAGWERDFAETEDKIGQLLEERRDYAGAEKEYRAALEKYERLAAAAPSDPSYPGLVAGVAYHLGRTLLGSGGDKAAAQSILAKARAALALIQRTANALSAEQSAIAKAVDELLKGGTP